MRRENLGDLLAFVAVARDRSFTKAAAKLGVDLSRAVAAVDTLQGADLARAADAARHVNDRLAGGASTITITTTTLIIILLVAILLIVAIK